MSSVVGLLTNQNCEVATLNLSVTTTVPSDAKAVVIAGPLVPLTSNETDLLQLYQEQGGAIVVMQDPLIEVQLPLSTTEPFVNFLANNWGVKIDNDVIVAFYNSYQSQGQAQPLYPLSKTYGTSTIVSRQQGIPT